MSKTKKKAGPKPIELDELQIRDVEVLAAYLPIKKIADYFGICEKSFRNLKSRDEKVFTAYNRGVSRAQVHAGKIIMRFMQYDGKNPCQLQLQFQAAKFYNQTKGDWSVKEEKKIKFDISNDAMPLDIINKAIGEIREGNITLSEVKQLTELAQAKQQLLTTPLQEQNRPALSEEFIRENMDTYKDMREDIRRYLSTKEVSNDK